LVGSALVRELGTRQFGRLVTRERSELDLRDQRAVDGFFHSERPHVVMLAAAKVGGIDSNNKNRWEFLHENLTIQDNVLGCALMYDVSKVVFFGSSCIYPKLAQQPIREEYLLTGPLEPTNEPYAIAKIAGLKLCEAYRDQYNCNFISVMPTNLYGPNDNYDLKNSHVLPALIRKFYEAKNNKIPSVEIWGTGSPMREFLHVDDLAEACYFLMEKYNDSLFMNVGYGEDISIRELAELVANVTGFEGRIEFNTTKPDGTPKKLMDSSRIHGLGWKPKIHLKEGIELTYRSFLKEGALV
jgi:GDP-L-fucose synthase